MWNIYGKELEMIRITGNEGCTIFYECSCGVQGRCMIKPLEAEGTIFVNVSCPICDSMERVKLIQYEDDKKNATNKLSWACVMYNEVTGYELKENLDD
jgi:hypothetical protein